MTLKVWNRYVGQWYKCLSDKYNDMPVVMDPEHASVHAGLHFHLSYSVTNLGSMTTPNDMITLSWKTPNSDYRAHLVVAGFSAQGTRFLLTEGKTGGGENPTASLTPLNSNRLSTITSTFYDLAAAPAQNRVSYDATAFTGGTVLHDEILGSGGGFSSTANQIRGMNEWVLAPDTFYQVSMYNTDNVTASLLLTWYEYTHEHGD
jgi:hypothetical protein